MSTETAKPGVSRGEFYRQCRIWHGYLSAFAFLALLFFAVTGILLNHPDALKVRVPPPAEKTLTLTPAEVASLKAAPQPAPVLVKIVAPRVRLKGRLKDSEAVGDELFVRMQGVRGSSDLRADLAAGTVSVVVEAQHPIAVANALHRGELAASAWRLVIDIAAVVLIALSLVGYVLFLSLRFRLRTALVLTGLSLAAMLAVFLAATP